MSQKQSNWAWLGALGLFIVPATATLSASCSDPAVPDGSGTGSMPSLHAAGGTATGGASDADTTAGSGGTTQAVVQDTVAPIDCESLPQPKPPIVTVEVDPAVDSTMSGGAIVPGVYVLARVVLAEAPVPYQETEYQMQFGLRSDGTGYFAEHLGHSYLYSGIEWSTKGNEFTYKITCSKTLDSEAFPYTRSYTMAESGQLLMMGKSLFVFEPQ
jgi:hypothetical protein